jgi:hypothetical protein
VVAAIKIQFELPAHFLGTAAQRDGFVLLAAFLISFLFIRTSARLMRSPKVPWWPGSVTTESGLHIHHLVWGIVLVLLSGFLQFALAPGSPWSEILAGAFGVGAGLTLDEFALWVRLEDVYWSQQGRSSLDAVVVAALIGGLVVLGLAPFDSSHAAAGESIALAVGIDLMLVLLAIIKGKPLLALIGVFIPPVALVASVRLASPTSPWARWRYGAESHKLARSRARFARSQTRRVRLLNAIGGAPSAIGGAPNAIGGAPETPTTSPSAVRLDTHEDG